MSTRWPTTHVLVQIVEFALVEPGEYTAVLVCLPALYVQILAEIGAVVVVNHAVLKHTMFGPSHGDNG